VMIDSCHSPDLAVIDGVRFSYGDESIPVVQLSGLKLKKGGVLGVIGDSGVGKTTLLKLIAGILKPDVGTIKFTVQCRFAFIFQNPALLPWRTVLENTYLPSHIGRDGLRDRDRHCCENLLRRYGLWEARYQLPRTLSGGMQQRVSIIRALASRPDVLLLDEPFTALDLSLKKQLLLDVDHYVQETNASAIYVTHDLDDVIRLSNEIVMLARKPTQVSSVFSFTTTRRDRITESKNCQDELQSVRRDIYSSVAELGADRAPVAWR